MTSIDRISELPNDVICHVLSFLSTQSSVQTSILSKRWRFVWTYPPFLGFTCNGFCRECKDTAAEAEGSIIADRNINTFHIGFGSCSYDEFKLWIAAIFAHNVRNLVITLNDRLKLPRFLFSCGTLVDLCILDSGFIHVDAAVYFPVLKKLRLVNVGYESDESLPNLISRCPVLEELIVERMVLMFCVVSSPTLTRLVMDIDDVIVINFINPALRYLRLRVYKSLKISARNLDSLTEADIDLINESKYSYSSSVVRFVALLYNVKCLTLSTRPMHVSDEEFSVELDVKFHNLAELKLCADWRFITSFLENANNLRVLTIRRAVIDNIQNWMEPKQVSTCLISDLETVRLVDFEWCREHEFDMVKYILKNAKVLKRMEIINTQLHELDSNEKLGVLERLALFNRGSLECQVAFV